MTSYEESVGPMEETIARIPQLINKGDVDTMINLQASAIDRLETTNNGLESCTILAQNKLSTTTKLFKKTAKQMSEAKKDLDVIYKKLTELKAKIRADKPHLFNENETTAQDER